MMILFYIESGLEVGETYWAQFEKRTATVSIASYTLPNDSRLSNGAKTVFSGGIICNGSYNWKECYEKLKITVESRFECSSSEPKILAPIIKPDSCGNRPYVIDKMKALFWYHEIGIWAIRYRAYWAVNNTLYTNKEDEREINSLVCLTKSLRKTFAMKGCCKFFVCTLCLKKTHIFLSRCASGLSYLFLG